MIHRTTKPAAPSDPLWGLGWLGAFLMVIGLMVLKLSWPWAMLRYEVGRWQPVPCELRQWDVGLKPDKSEVYVPTLALSYVFQWNGASRTGTVLDATAGKELPGLNELERRGEAARTVGQICYVNPRKPAETSFLQPGLLAPTLVLGSAMVLILLGGGLFLALLRAAAGGLISGLQGRPVPKPRVKKEAWPAGRLIVSGFCMFLGLGLAVVQLLDNWGKPDWKAIGPSLTPVTARILASGVKYGSGVRSRTPDLARVAFSYEFNGRVWHSGWLDFDGDTAGKNNAKVRKSAARHPVGQVTTCWVDPSSPWQAVLEKEGPARNSVSEWVIIIVLAALGLGGLVFSIREIRRRTRSPRESSGTYGRGKHS